MKIDNECMVMSWNCSSINWFGVGLCIGDDVVRCGVIYGDAAIGKLWNQ